LTNFHELTPIDSGPHGVPVHRLDLRGSGIPSSSPTVTGSASTRTLGVGGIVLMVVAAAAPLGFVAGSIPIVIGVSQSIAVPQYFVIATVLLLLFSVGFTAMSAHVRNAGAFYSYVLAGLGRVTGLGAATLAMGAYGLLVLAVNAYLGVVLNAFVLRASGLDVAWWIYSLVSLGLVAFLAYRDIELSSRVLGVLLVAETLVVVVLDVAVIASGGAEGPSLAPFDPTQLQTGAPALGLMFAFFGFFGFEATAVFRGEARDPDRTIPRATFIAVIGIGLFYALSSWVVVIGAGSGSAVESASTSPATMVIDLAVRYVSPVVANVMQVLLLTSIFACVLAFHNVITRYQVTLGQHGVLPQSLARISPKHNAPSTASLTLSVITAGLTVALVLTGLDPILIYTWLTGASTLGIVALMALTSLAVIVYFRRSRDLSDRRPWATLVAPGAALVGLVAILLLVVANFSSLTGGVEAAVVLALLTVVAFLSGVGGALFLRARRPSVFAALSAN
jgi:amino acid transporter